MPALPSARALPGSRLLAAWLLACLPWVAWRAPQAPGDDAGTQRPPATQFGLPLGDGQALWFHPGLNPPPDQAGVRWSLESGGVRAFGGRTVDVLRYVARDEAGNEVAARGYAQADFVDPSTGEVVGGLGGWGGEGFPDEPPPPTGCEGR